MIVKFTFNGNVKKISFKESLKEFSNLNEVASKFSKLGAEKIALSFVDTENERVPIADDLDIEYFFDQLKIKKDSAIEITALHPSDEPKDELFKEMSVSQCKSVLMEEPAVTASLPDTQFASESPKPESGFFNVKRPASPKREPVSVPSNKEQEPEVKKETVEAVKQEAQPAQNTDTRDKPCEPPKVDFRQVECPFLKNSRNVQNEYRCEFKNTDEPAKKPEEPQVKSQNPLLDMIEIVADKIREHANKLHQSMPNLTPVTPPAPTPEPKVTAPVPDNTNSFFKSGVQERAQVTVHRGVRCDGCNAAPIHGTRFKCLVCHDFDLCEACERRGHDHPMLRLPTVHRLGVNEEMRRTYLRLTGSHAGGY